MKKNVKIILIVIGVLVGLVLLDTLQARILKHSPIISWKEELSDDDSWVDRGILIDTYYCTKEQDIVTVSWKLKGNKFTCPIDNIKIEKFVNYDFSVTVDSNSKYEKISAFDYKDVKYYYGNTNFSLSLTENNYKYTIDVALTNELVTFDNILNKARSTAIAYDGGSKLYKYDNFTIIVCNTIDGNNDVIIGDAEMQINNYCK